MRDGNVREDGEAKRRERELHVIVEGVVGVYFERVVVALGVGDAMEGFELRSSEEPLWNY